MSVTYKNRNEVPEQEKWCFQDIYHTKEDWDNDYRWIEDMIKKLPKFDGKIHNGESLYQYMSLAEEVLSKLNLVFAYSMLQADIDTRDVYAQSLLDQAKQLSVKFSSATSFFKPLLLTFEECTIKEFINQDARLNYFEKDLYDSIRFKKHILSKEKEEILSNLGDALSSPANIYNMISNADIKFGKITDENGQKVELSRGMYSQMIDDEDRNKRREAYKAYYKPYLQLKNSIASTLSASIKNNVTIARLRNYPSALEKSLYMDLIPKEVYENLILATKSNIAPLHQYMSIRKQKLGLEDLRQYDLSAPLVEGVKLNISYDRAYETVLKALEVLGEDYVSILKNFKDCRYIDVREVPGKKPGAYNLGVYGVHPFVLLNHHNDLNSMFTLIHELGHAMHSWYSNEFQPRISAYYSIFVAEVASTVNEVLLIHYLLENETSLEVRKYLINHFIDQYKSTFFTQVMFAEFEKITHEYSEEGKPLNEKVFCEIYESLFREYFGNEIEFDEEVQYGWARIPHFYRPFYVYKYATGFAAAIHIAGRILSGDETTLINYIDFLKSGSSDNPLDLLKNVGVDLSKPEPIENALKHFEQLLKQFISLEINNNTNIV
ncbi:oligoendopeptidase F [Lysinibacillus fusiformis]|uniref:oligoendopeptidase F n=1 Tax=Lysinibacillus sp. PWR01 TaxID=3342384 RepID=UPI00372D2C1F